MGTAWYTALRGPGFPGVTSIDEVLARVRDVHGCSYVDVHRAGEGQSGEGAWFAIDDDGRPVVVKWSPDETVAHRYEILLRTLAALRARGYPAPSYGPILVVPGATVAVQQRLPGQSGVTATADVVGRVLTINELQVGVTDAPLLDHGSWGELIVHSLVVGENGYCQHESLRAWSPRAATLLERIEGVGATTTPSALPVTGVVHYDLHVGNLLVDDGTLVAVIDWEGASLGDPRFDLVCFAQHLEGRGWSPLAVPAWRVLQATVAPHVLRAYVAHVVLRLVDWQIRHQPSDVTNQLAVGEGLLDRYA
jgi:hypothetical protein